MKTRCRRGNEMTRQRTHKTKETKTRRRTRRRRDKEWEMGDGRWEMGDGRWEMGDGRCEAAMTTRISIDVFIFQCNFQTPTSNNQSQSNCKRQPIKQQTRNPNTGEIKSNMYNTDDVAIIARIINGRQEFISTY
jgi:hypothetical protein